MTSLSALKTGHLNNFETNVLPEPMPPIMPTLIILA